MNVFAFVLILVAAVVFGIDTYLTKRLISLGLCLLSIGLIVQFATTSHTVTF